MTGPPGAEKEPAMPNEATTTAGSGIPRIDTVMTRAPISVALDATLRDASDLMIDHEIRHLPVTDSGSLVGILSDRDVASAENATEPELGDRLRVRDVCSLDVYAVTGDEPLDGVLTEMAERRIGSVVVTEGDAIAGVFTATDACRCFAAHLRAQDRPNPR
jgi:CBS domain-containing protein